MPLTPDQQAAFNLALERLGNFYDGDHAYNPATYPGAFRQGGNVVNFVPALKDVATVMQAASTLVADAAAASAASPKALRVDSAQSFSDAEKAQGVANLALTNALRGDIAQTFTDAQVTQILSNLRKALRFDQAQTLSDTERGMVLTSLAYALRADAAQSFTAAQQAQLASNLGLVMPSAFQARLQLQSATQVLLVPETGLNTFINGKLRQIPVGGVPLTLAGLSQDTVYNVYKYWTGSAVALLASTVAPVVDQTYGHKVANGDSTMSWAGMVNPVDLGNGLQFADQPGYRLVASAYHKRRKSIGTAASSGSAGTAYTEFGTRAYFLSLGQDDCDVGVIGMGYPTQYDNMLWYLAVDGQAVTPELGPAIDNNHGMNISEYTPVMCAAGLHYLSLFARSGGSSIFLSHRKTGAVLS